MVVISREELRLHLDNFSGSRKFRRYTYILNPALRVCRLYKCFISWSSRHMAGLQWNICCLIFGGPPSSVQNTQIRRFTVDWFDSLKFEYSDEGDPPKIQQQMFYHRQGGVLTTSILYKCYHLVVTAYPWHLYDSLLTTNSSRFK